MRPGTELAVYAGVRVYLFSDISTLSIEPQLDRTDVRNVAKQLAGTIIADVSIYAPASPYDLFFLRFMGQVLVQSAE